VTIYVDADACPVKAEVYRVAGRYATKVMVVANSPMRVPADELVQLVVCRGYGEVDDWIAQHAGPSDIVITADIPLAARCLAQSAFVLDSKGNPFTDKNIGDALAMRELTDHLRQGGAIIGGPSALTPKDRSRFLASLDEAINAVLKRNR
jgi:uncharacterized protein YaiI (UPF0178 family)